MQRIEQHYYQLRAYIDDLYELSKLSSDTLSIKTKRQNVTTVLIRVIDELKPLFEAKQQMLLVNVEDDIVADVDAKLMRLALSNLLRSACKYSPEHSCVVVSADSDSSPGQWVLSVSDDGQVLEADQIESLLHPFEPMDNKQEGVASLRGLGLAICNQVVHLHSGSMNIVSHADNHEPVTKITLIFPLKGS